MSYDEWLWGKSPTSDKDYVIKDLKESWSKTKPVERKNCPRCGQPMDYWTPVGDSPIWRCEKCNVTVSPTIIPIIITPLWKRAIKCFVHGIAFSAMFLALEILWIFSTVFLIAIGNLLGLIAGFLLLFFIAGAVNSILLRFIWGFYMQSSVVTIFFHGLILFIILALIDIVFMIPLLIYRENLTVTIAGLIVKSFIYGFIGEKIGERFVE